MPLSDLVREVFLVRLQLLKNTLLSYRENDPGTWKFAQEPWVNPKEVVNSPDTLSALRPGPAPRDSCDNDFFHET